MLEKLLPIPLSGCLKSVLVHDAGTAAAFIGKPRVFDLSYLLLHIVKLTLQLLNQLGQLCNLPLVALQIITESAPLLLKFLELVPRSKPVVSSTHVIHTMAYIRAMLFVTHPGLVQSVHFFFALLSYFFVAAFDILDDVLHVQVSAVVHFHHDRGVTELAVHLSSFLQVTYWLRSLQMPSPIFPMVYSRTKPLISLAEPVLGVTSHMYLELYFRKATLG